MGIRGAKPGAHMPYVASDVFQPTPLSEPIRHRTLVLIRWGALAGQSVTFVGAMLLQLQFDWQAVVAVIVVAALFNLWLSLPQQMQKGNGVRPAMQLCLDLLQLTLLLTLTGGLSNPFALLALAPVTIAATAMTGRETIALGVLTVILISLMGWLGVPLATSGGVRLELAPLLRLGHWLALVIGVVFFAIYARRVAWELAATSAALAATQLALAREQQLQHLGGVIAAAAHEMGTPLATMKLVATELGEEIQEALPDRRDLSDDIGILGSSVSRCQQILRDMGEAGKDDMLLSRAPLLSLLEEAASPHADRRRITITSSDETSGAEPIVSREPGVVHGLRNLIQNAVDFAHDQVTVTAFWNDSQIAVTIQDDGAGYPPHMVNRLGEPFLTTRGYDGRAHYEGMGLGLFIARALLERTGARMRFENTKIGARVTVNWSRNLFARD